MSKKNTVMIAALMLLLTISLTGLAQENESGQVRSLKDLYAATETYKKSLQESLVFRERNVQQLTEKIKRLQSLHALSIISIKSVHLAEQELEDAQKKVEETRLQVEQANKLAGETSAAAARAEQNEAEEQRFVRQMEPALRPAWQKLRVKYRQIVASANPEYNFIQTQIMRNERSYVLFATHSMFTSYSFDIGPTARMVAKWIAAQRTELRRAHITHVGLMNEDGQLGYCWLEVE